MIKFDFDREKLTPREAQIVDAIIEVQWDARTFVIAERAKRESLERIAERVRGMMSARFPDLSIRWEWREPQVKAD